MESDLSAGRALLGFRDHLVPVFWVNRPFKAASLLV